MKLISLADYSPQKVEFTLNSDLGGFTHNFTSDLHGVAIWERGRSEQEKIISELRRRFQIIAGYEISWSPTHVADNFNRLYGRPPGNPSSRHEWAGAGPFLYLVAMEKQPHYVYRKNLSGRVELTNRAIADFKVWARKQYDKRLPHVIHSSNSIGEFFKDSALILGVEELKRVVALASRPDDWNGATIPLEKDLEGAKGWPTIDRLFSTLAYTQRWTLLRPSENLVNGIYEPGADIDILSENASDFVSFANALPRLPGRAGPIFLATINSIQIPIDLREPGDFDLDPSWQRHLLNSYFDTVPPVLQASEQFFYLAYHCIFHKGLVKSEHARTLARLASEIGIELNSPRDSHRNPSSELKEIISGYLRATGFRVSDPAPLGLGLEPSGAWENIAPITLTPRNVPTAYRLPQGALRRFLLQLTPALKRKVVGTRIYRMLKKKFVRSFRFLRWFLANWRKSEFHFGLSRLEIESHDRKFSAMVVGKVYLPIRALRVSLTDWQSNAPPRRYQTSVYGSPHFLYALDIVRGNNALRGRENYLAYKKFEHSLTLSEAGKLADRYQAQVLEIYASYGEADFTDVGILGTVEGLNSFRVNDGVHRLAAVAAISDSAKVSTFVRV